MRNGPVTTEEILDVAEQRTGLTRPQLLVLVAKSATARPQEGRWSSENEMFDGKSPFSMEGIRMSRRPRERELKVTVSVRPGEWLDRDGPPLTYRDPLLATDNSFPINGLTRDELAAEKLLGWCGKPLPKHLVDLAYLVATFTKASKLRNLRSEWERFSTTELLFLPGEVAEDSDATLMKVENVPYVGIARNLCQPGRHHGLSLNSP